MRIEQAVKGVKHWIEKYDYCSNLESGTSADGHYVRFLARTTKTRASSIVTRIAHIVQDAVEDRKFDVFKQLDGPPPEARADLASWTIIVRLPTRSLHREAA